MALNGDTLGSAIKSAVQGISIPTDDVISDSTIDQIWKAISGQIVSHFQNNAVVSTTGQATGVQSGGSVAPTTSTGTIS